MRVDHHQGDPAIAKQPAKDIVRFHHPFNQVERRKDNGQQALRNMERRSVVSEERLARQANLQVAAIALQDANPADNVLGDLVA